jgi:hypothetical protein
MKPKSVKKIGIRKVLYAIISTVNFSNILKLRIGSLNLGEVDVYSVLLYHAGLIEILT